MKICQNKKNYTFPLIIGGRSLKHFLGRFEKLNFGHRETSMISCFKKSLSKIIKKSIDLFLFASTFLLKKILTILLILVSFLDGSIYSIDEYDAKRIEKLWSLDAADRKPQQIENNFPKPSKNYIPPFLTMYLPEKQEFQIIPQSDNVISGKFGSTISIPANSISLPMSFRKGDIVLLELIEYTNDLDFLTSGIEQIYTDSKGTTSILESGGMIRLSISYYSKPLVLKKGSKLKFSLPNKDGRQMKVFKIDETRDAWVERGVEEKPQSGDEPKNRVSSIMDDIHIWGFKNPNYDTTCLQGSIEVVEKNPPFTVAVVGMDFKGSVVKNFSTNEFTMNTVRNKSVKLIAMDQKGNISVSQEIKPSGERIFVLPDDKGNAKCMNLGTVSLTKIPTDVRQNREKFIKFLGLSEEQ
jgi:hypothetical protein